MRKATKYEIAMDDALLGVYCKIEERARTIIEGSNDPIANAFQIVDLVRQWEKVRDAMIKLDSML